MFMNKARAYVAPEVEILDVTLEAGFAQSTGAVSEGYDTNDSQNDTDAWN